MMKKTETAIHSREAVLGYWRGIEKRVSGLAYKAGKGRKGLI